MATVNGITVARADQIEDNSVIGGHISGTNLVLDTAGGTQINVGRVIQPAIDAWPVGSIFMHVSSTNPNIYLGGGTWARWGRGSIPISLDEGQAEFNTLEKTGGSKTHQITEAEMPYHTHETIMDGNINAYLGGAAGGWMFGQAPITHPEYTGITSTARGSGVAYNNMPPYIAIYMWKRTA